MPELETRHSLVVWQPAGFEGLELNKTRTNLSFQPRHVHDAYQIGLIVRGSGTFQYRGARLNVSAGRLAVVGAGEAHSCFTNAAGWTFGVLYVCPNLLEKVGPEITGKPPQPVSFSSLVFDNAGLAKTMLDLFGSFERPTALLEQETRILYTLKEIIRWCADDPPSTRSLGHEHRAVGLVKDYLRAHYTEEITLAELALLTKLSRFYLLRVFSKTQGLTPHDYQMSLRISAAKASLLWGRSPAVVAAETGFADQAHLTRTFKKHTGVTPGAYQACLQLRATSFKTYSERQLTIQGESYSRKESEEDQSRHYSGKTPCGQDGV